MDLNLRERLVLGAIVVAVFGLGLYPGPAMEKTELAAREYQALVAGERGATQAAANVHRREAAR